MKYQDLKIRDVSPVPKVRSSAGRLRPDERRVSSATLITGGDP